MAFSVNPRLSQVLSCANQSQSESTTETTTEASSPQLPPAPTTDAGQRCTCHCSSDPKGEPFQLSICSQRSLSMMGRLVGIHSLNR